MRLCSTLAAALLLSIASSSPAADVHRTSDANRPANGNRLAYLDDIFGTNITPDPKTGIGVWSLEAFIRAKASQVLAPIRQG